MNRRRHVRNLRSAKEPVEGVPSVMVRDIARIITPDHVPFVYKESSQPSEP
jgi:hypothetical protein